MKWQAKVTEMGTHWFQTEDCNRSVVPDNGHWRGTASIPRGNGRDAHVEVSPQFATAMEAKRWAETL